MAEMRSVAHHLPVLQVVLSVAAAFVAFSSVIIGWRFNLENSTKLYAMTFMLVRMPSLRQHCKPCCL